ncbi:MAG: hypothetical protein ISN64_03170 [Rickettsia sp.]|nr:hypothetical protein [Rickettsia sp.]
MSRFLHRQEFNFLVEKHESKLVSINDTEYLKLSSIEGKMTAFLSKKDADQISLRFVSEAIKCIKEDSSLQLLYKHNVTNLLTTIITSEIHVCDIHYLFEVLKIVTLTLDKEMLLEIFSSTKPFLTRISDFSQRIYDPPPYKIIENLLSDYNTLEENQALRTILELLNEKINIDYSDLLNELNIKIIEQQIILSNEYQTFDDKEISNHVELVAETSEISDNVEICS